MGYKRKSKFKKILKFIVKTIQFLANLCAITGISLYGTHGIMSVELKGTYIPEENLALHIFNILLDSFLNNWSIILFFTFLTMLISNGLCIPLFKIYKKGILPQDARPSYIKIGVLNFLIGCLFCYHILVDVGKAQIPQIEIEREDIPDSHINDVEEEMEEPSLTEKEIVEIYIIRCETEVISMEEWNTLSDSELYHIRNGIFAYVGQLFTSEYYDEYLWYHPKYTSDEAKDYLNSCQWDNVENIKFVENQRL